MQKLYGPYQRKDGRWILTTGKSTISYPKWLYQEHYKVILGPSETVDHIDNNPNNNSIENLQILSRKENIEKSRKPRQYYTFICPVCKKEATKPMNHVKHNLNKGCSGPYCSRSCAGILRS